MVEITREHIEQCIDKMARIIDAPANLLPACIDEPDNSRSYIEIGRNGRLTYIVKGDRGEKRFINAIDLDHLLYIVFSNITISLAIDLVGKNPDLNQDPRRQQFQVQLGLLDKINKEWRRKEELSQRTAEMQFPFDDDEGKRLLYFRELLGSGFLYEEALQKTNDNFRLNIGK